MTPLPSASKLEMTERCTGSAVLPGVDSTDQWSELGTVKHRYLHTALVSGPAAAIAEVPEEHREACESIDLPNLPPSEPGAWVGEVAFAFNCATGEARELGRGLERQYEAAGLTEFELPGTIDLFGMAATGDAVVVVDYKTGRQPVTPAQENLQLLFAAMCAALVHAKTKARGAILYVREDGKPYWDYAEWDAFDLDEVKARLKKLAGIVLRARRAYEPHPTTGEVKEPRVHVGKWCRYCPALVHCPAQMRFVQRLVATPAEVEGELSQMLTVERAGHLYDRIKGTEQALKRAKAALYAFASRQPLPLPGGLVLGIHEKKRETINGTIAHLVIEQAHGRDVADKAVEMATSKAAMNRALKLVKKREGGAVAPRARALLDTLRTIEGGIVTKLTNTVEEYSPGAVPQLEEGEDT